MASRKEYEMLFELNAQLGGGYTGTFSSAQQQLVNMQRELDALAKAQSDISAYERQQAAVEATQKKLEALQAQHDNIQREIGETEGSSSSLDNALLRNEQQIDRTSEALAVKTQKLDQMGAALNEAGIDTGNLGKASAELSGEMENLMKEQEAAAEGAARFGASASQAFAAVQQALVAAGVAKALKEIYDFLSDCAGAAMEFEQAMAGVRRTVGGSDGELAAISGAFKEMSLYIPIATSELGKIAEGAGQLGIAREDVVEFTRIMAMLGTTTDLTADNAATMLAQFANITGLNPADYARLGSTVASLGDATATTASKVVDMSQGLAAAASIAGMSEIDILGISAAVGSLGIEAQAGSTSMSTLIQTLYKAVETGDGLKEFADVANMSASEFKQAWGDNAVGALDAFIQGLNDTERNGKSAIVILDELGITNVRQTKAILGLAQAGDLLSSTVAQGNQAWEENTALQQKADIMYGTTGSKLIMMQNAFNSLKVAIGDNYTPALQGMYETGSNALKGITEFVQKNPALVKGLTAFIGVVGIATAALTAYAAIQKIIIALDLASTFTNPVMLAIAAAGALVAVLVAWSSASKTAEDEIRELSAASREQYNEMKELEQQYYGVCASMGETSAEAQLLKGELDEATDAYERNKQTAAEAAQAHKEAMDAYAELNRSSAEAAEATEKQGSSIMSLAAKLETLMGAESRDEAAKQKVLSIVELLNEAMPELGLAYDEYADSLNMGADAVRALAEAEVARMRNATAHAELLNKLSNSDSLRASAEEATTQMELYRKELELVEEARAELLAQDLDQATMAGMLDPINEEYAEAARLLDEWTDKAQQATGAYQENEAAIDSLTESMANYNQAQEEAGVLSSEFEGLIADVTEEMAALADAYNESYEAALNSIQGQYEIWDDAATVIPTSIDAVIASMQGQKKYWDDYNANIALLTGKAAEFEGLGDMISSFADGSPKSVNMIAGLASASDEKIKSMVSDWELLQESQKTTADSLAELETDFSSSMATIQTELNDAVAGMDLSEEAAKAGRETIRGLVQGIDDMLPAVQAAYSRIALAGQYGTYGLTASLAVSNSYNLYSNSHAGGLYRVPYDGYIALLHAGERVLRAEEAEAVKFAPDLAKAFDAQDEQNTINAYNTYSAFDAQGAAVNSGSDLADRQRGINDLIRETRLTEAEAVKFAPYFAQAFSADGEQGIINSYSAYNTRNTTSNAEEAESRLVSEYFRANREQSLINAYSSYDADNLNNPGALGYQDLHLTRSEREAESKLISEYIERQAIIKELNRLAIIGSPAGAGSANEIAETLKAQEEIMAAPGYRAESVYNAFNSQAAQYSTAQGSADLRTYSTNLNYNQARGMRPEVSETAYYASAQDEAASALRESRLLEEAAIPSEQVKAYAEAADMQIFAYAPEFLSMLGRYNSVHGDMGAAEPLLEAPLAQAYAEELASESYREFAAGAINAQPVQPAEAAAINNEYRVYAEASAANNASQRRRELLSSVAYPSEYSSSSYSYNSMGGAAPMGAYIEPYAGAGPDAGMGGSPVINNHITLKIEVGAASNSETIIEALQQAGDDLGDIITSKIEDYYAERARVEYR